MRFGCFRFFYFNLAQQFESVKMSVYDNKWSEIYDFTPKEGNWSFLPIDTKASDLVGTEATVLLGKIDNVLLSAPIRAGCCRLCAAPSILRTHGARVSRRSSHFRRLAPTSAPKRRKRSTPTLLSFRSRRGTVRRNSRGRSARSSY